MATREIICAIIIFAASLNLILTIDDTDLDYEKDVRVVGRAYSLAGCSYENQAGYTCLSCHRALHCYVGGAAIMVDCYGLFRYCRDGHCSRKQGAKCFEDTKLTTLAPDVNVTSLADAAVEETVASDDHIPLSVPSEEASISTANDVE